MKKQKAECINRVRIHAFSMLILLIMMAGCDSVTSPDTTTNVQRNSTDLQNPDAVPAEALNTISDGAHGGTEGFYFLPPMVKSPDFSGTFDGSLSPVVEICETAACSNIHASFSMTEGTGSQFVRVEEEDEHYIVNWHTDQTGIVVGQTYRVRVKVAGTVLGHADIYMAENGREARNTISDQVIALVDGRTLPVKFRIEEGAVFVVGSGGGTFTSNDGGVTIEVPPDAVDGDIGIIVTPVTELFDDPDVVPGLVFEFLPSPYAFAKPVILTIVYDPSSLPIEIPEDELRLLAFDGNEWVQLPGSSVDMVTTTVSGPLESFSLKAVGRGKDHANVGTVVVSPATAYLAFWGQVQQFTATLYDLNGEPLVGPEVTWSSDDVSVATVDSDGLATAVGLHLDQVYATITAKAGNASGTAVLTVCDSTITICEPL